MALYGRQVLLQIGTAGDEGRSFSGLRTVFKTKSDRTSTPNKGSIQLYNPHADTISLAEDPDSVIRLYAGYQAPQLIFSGNPTKNGCKVVRQGPDRVMTIEVQDGLRAYQTTRISVSFSTQTTLQEVYDQVAAAMGLPEGTVRISSDVRFTQGGVFSGYARDLLDRIALSTSSGWFVRDGTLQLVGTTEDTGELAVVYSSTTKNLIGSPSRTDKGVEVTALLSPGIRPGMPFRVDADAISGDYIADVVEFNGDSYGGPFYVKILGVPK